MAVALLIIPKHLRVFCEHQWGCISVRASLVRECWALVLQTPPPKTFVRTLYFIYTSVVRPLRGHAGLWLGVITCSLD